MCALVGFVEHKSTVEEHKTVLDDDEEEDHSVESSILRAREEQRRQILRANAEHKMTLIRRKLAPDNERNSSQASVCGSLTTPDLDASQAGEGNSETSSPTKASQQDDDEESCEEFIEEFPGTSLLERYASLSNGTDEVSAVQMDLLKEALRSVEPSPRNTHSHRTCPQKDAGELNPGAKSAGMMSSKNNPPQSSRKDVNTTSSSNRSRASGTGLDEPTLVNLISKSIRIQSSPRSLEMKSSAASPSSSSRSSFSFSSSSKYDSLLTEQLRLSSLRRRKRSDKQEDEFEISSSSSTSSSLADTTSHSSSTSTNANSQTESVTNTLKKIGSLSTFTQSVSSKMTSLFDLNEVTSNLPSATSSHAPSQSSSTASSKRPSIFSSFQLVKQTVEAAPHDPIANMGSLVHNRVLSFLSDIELAKVQRTSREWYLAVESPTLWDALLPTLGIDYAVRFPNLS